MRTDYLYYLTALILLLIAIPSSILIIIQIDLYSGIIFLLLLIISTYILFSERTRKLEFFKESWKIKIIVFAIICILYWQYSNTNYLKVGSGLRAFLIFPYLIGYSLYGFITTQLASVLGYILESIYLYALSSSYIILITKLIKRFRKKASPHAQPVNKPPNTQ